jgi:polar amino acid transport system permease protein
VIALWEYRPVLLDGLLVTVLVAVLSIAGCAVVSVILGIARSSNKARLRVAAGAAVELLRGASALIYLFWAYYALPAFFPGTPQLSPLAVSIIVLSLVGGAYGAEIVSGAIAAIPRGQLDACLAMGFSRRRAMRLVILPQAASQIVPAFGSLAVDLVKWTSIVSFVGVQDVLYVANAVRTLTYETVAVYGAVGAIYWILCLATSLGFQAIETVLPLNRALRARP